ncbi:hypothetical protein HDV05_003400 [Chytridiales sp. JEL 0842]|nr:hypothetical protein HDV05_003400 [Chytridiales sp. JEL 0842]
MRDGTRTNTQHFAWYDLGISVLNFNRPAARNALGKTFMAQFRSALTNLRFDEQVRVVILRSMVDRVFCAGADLKERAGMSPMEVAAFVHGLRTAFGDLESLPMPTIAAIDGAALGGGLEVALATDLRVAGAGAKLGLPETKLAIIPGAGGTQRLPRLIGPSKAKELIFTGRVLDAKGALEKGLVNYAVDGSAFEKSLALAREILPAGPVAVRMAKLAVDKGSQLDLYDRSAAFGPQIEEEGLTARLIAIGSDTPIGGDENGCTPFIFNTTGHTSKYPWIPLVVRGGCSFVEKVRCMQESGAAAVVVGDNIDQSGLITMYASDDSSDILIPSVFVPRWEYLELRMLAMNENPSADTLEKPNRFTLRPVISRITSVKEYLPGEEEQPQPDPTKGIPELVIRLEPSDSGVPFFEILLIATLSPIAIAFFLWAAWIQRIILKHWNEVASTKMVNALPVRKYDPLDRLAEADVSCPICLEDYVEDDELRVLLCTHEFHVACVDKSAAEEAKPWEPSSIFSYQQLGRVFGRTDTIVRAASSDCWGIFSASKYDWDI